QIPPSPLPFRFRTFIIILHWRRDPNNIRLFAAVVPTTSYAVSAYDTKISATDTQGKNMKHGTSKTNIRPLAGASMQERQRQQDS
ncbi:hypothetical protein, partial [Nitrososphaera sp.]|uniref:hypothetical protein n=1 Tax=Nitrososphaera sp. TaxID=1971748 RepID=UPI00307F65B7